MKNIFGSQKIDAPYLTDNRYTVSTQVNVPYPTDNGYAVLASCNNFF